MENISIIGDILGFATIPSIVVICYLVAECVKASELNNKYIPIVCGVLGGILGVVAMFAVPDFPATDYLAAVAIGIVSGFAATGINQAIKQATKKKDSE